MLDSCIHNLYFKLPGRSPVGFYKVFCSVLFCLVLEGSIYEEIFLENSEIILLVSASERLVRILKTTGSLTSKTGYDRVLTSKN